MPKDSDEQLRDMAQHRGLTLVKSRKRKPGVGDFGKFGLSDRAGQPLFGIGDEGLTASAQDIREYLRTSEQGTWQQSAETTPDTIAPRKSPPLPPVRDEETAVKRRPRTAPTKPPRQKSSDRVSIEKPELKRNLKPEPEPKAEPELHVRAAAASDGAALSALLGQLVRQPGDPKHVQENLGMVRKAKGGVLVADVGDIVGCCSWAIIHTVHRGAIGRLTALVVDKKHRRRGIGTALLTAATEAMKKAGCRQLEAMSDIAVNNSHNFFRSLKFEQTSYRFVLGIEA